MTEILWIIGLVAVAFGIWYGNKKPSNCTHPFETLVITKESTTEYKDDDFSAHKVYLTCMLCKSDLVRGCSTLNGGVDGFLARAKK